MDEPVKEIIIGRRRTGWLRTALVAVAAIFLARNLEALIEHFGLHESLTDAVEWSLRQNWLAPFRWLGSLLQPLWAFLLSDLFLGMMLMAVVWLVADYRDYAFRFFQGRSNPTDPAMRIKRDFWFLAFNSDRPSATQARLADMRAEAAKLSDERNLPFLVETIALSVESELENCPDDKIYFVIMGLMTYMILVRQAIKRDPKKREAAIGSSLIMKKDRLLPEVFVSRLRSYEETKAATENHPIS